MKHATVALRSLLGLVAASVGLEGALLVAGTAVLAAGSGIIHPAGPYLVVGAVCLLLGLALAVHPRRAE